MQALADPYLKEYVQRLVALALQPSLPLAPPQLLPPRGLRGFTLNLYDVLFLQVQGP